MKQKENPITTRANNKNSLFIIINAYFITNIINILIQTHELLKYFNNYWVVTLNIILTLVVFK